MDGGILKQEKSKGIGGARREVTSSLSAAMGLIGKGLVVHCDELGEQGQPPALPGPS